MRRRFKQLPNGKLVEINPGRPPYAGTYTVGDVMDAMQDQERHKRERREQDRRERKQLIIDLVNKYG